MRDVAEKKQRIAGALEIQSQEIKKYGHSDIRLGVREMIKLATGVTSYGTHPLHGELIQQYRWSTVGWNNFKSSQIFFK